MCGERIKEARKRIGISQKMLSMRISMAQSAVSSWERNDKVPSAESISRLTEVLGVTSDYLLGKTDNPLSLIRNETPYAQVTPFEKEILEAYRGLPLEGKKIVCQSLGLQHPASDRAKAKNQ